MVLETVIFHLLPDKICCSVLFVHFLNSFLLRYVITMLLKLNALNESHPIIKSYTVLTGIKALARLRPYL